jgi:tetratricopeptide (TPR) repeat protein
MHFLVASFSLGLSFTFASTTGDITEGQYVFVARSGALMRAGPEPGEPKIVGRVHDLTLRVLKVKGNYAAVRSSGVDGWIKKSDVVPYNKALDYFTGRIRSDPKDAYAHAARAAARMGKGKNEDKALADLDEAIRLDPHLAAAFEQRGYIAYGNKVYDKSLADLNEAIRLDPRIRWPYHVRGWIWYRKKDYDKALADYEEALRIDPAEAVFYRDRGNVALMRKQYDRALADYSKATHLNATYSVPFLQRGKVWVQMKQWGKALADFNEVVRLDPKGSYGHGALAWLLATCPEAKYRDGGKAVESAQRAYELNKGPDELATLAAAYAETGDFERAAHWQTKAIAQAPAELKGEQEKRLDLYKNKRPYRQE